MDGPPSQTSSTPSPGHPTSREAFLNPSGRTLPMWYAGVRVPEFGPLTGPLRADVCVVGAGIAGLTTAYLLAKSGRTVAVVSDKQVGGGETGRTSAHLASAIDDGFVNIVRMHGVQNARLHYQSHADAIDALERIATDESIACDFARVDGYLFGAEDGEAGLLERELEAALSAGVSDAEMLERVPAGVFVQGPAIRFPRQARFHPLKYLIGLAGVLRRLGVTINCGDRVVDMTGDGPVRVRTLNGKTVEAEAAVAATNVPSPINNWAGVYTKQAAYRTYVAALEVGHTAVADALYWDTADPYHYVRLDNSTGRALLLVGGEDHKTGQHNGVSPADRFGLLAEWARRHFAPSGPVVFRWSGQVSEPEDGVAFIGRAPTRDHAACFVITGDSGMGLTHATLGARLVADLILGRPNPWEKLYEPARKPTGAPAEFVRENLNAAAQLADYVRPGAARSAEEIPPGSGAVIRRGVQMVAAHRDEAGSVRECSAVCTHLKCVVRWNEVEKSWDCPCHGSRFDAGGKVIIGPAVEDLRRLGGGRGGGGGRGRRVVNAKGAKGDEGAEETRAVHRGHGERAQRR